VVTALPLDFGRQCVQQQRLRSEELNIRSPDLQQGSRRHVSWIPRLGKDLGPFQIHLELVVAVNAHASHPQAASEVGPNLPPRPGEYLGIGARSGTDAERIARRAAELTAGLESPMDVAEAIFRFVDEAIATEPRLDGTTGGPADCLRLATGDARAKARLLTALLRSREIPARLVTGLTLSKGHEQVAHYWIEAWLCNRWFPMCPIYHHFGRVPPTFLVFGWGDMPIIRGQQVRDLDYAFLVEKAPEPSAGADSSLARRLLRAVSFHALPPPEQQLVGFLLLLPAAALIVCVYRNVIGLHSFGTFAPALIGLAFRDLYSLPGLLIFVSILLIGWFMRRLLDRYHLLQVPRQAFMLSLVVFVLIGVTFVANSRSGHATPTSYVSLFPLIILTGMIERFWTLEIEDSTAASFRTLAATILIAGSIAALLSIPAVVRYLFRFPETLGIIMAGQLLLGRYTGYRLSELVRFREMLRDERPSLIYSSINRPARTDICRGKPYRVAESLSENARDTAPAR
jgi:hypothetical protein